MRVGIIGDMHLGINEHKYKFNDYHLKCINHIYGEFRKWGIQNIIYLGDVFDKRYSISVKTLKLANEIFNNEFKQYFLLGNHDVTYKNSNKLNSVEILLGDKNKVTTELPEELYFEKKFLMVPWINKSNIQEATKIIKNSKADYLLGHLDLNGFEMIRGFVSTKGQFDLKLLKKFKQVVTGHFHCFSQKNNITYLGNVCQMTWNDFNVKKFAGFIDTETDKLNLIDIPYNMYEVIRIKSTKDIVDPQQFKDKIIKVYLYTKRTIKVEKFISELVDIALSVNVIDEQVMHATADFDIEASNMSILELWSQYLDEMEIPKKDQVICDKIFKQTYLKITSGDVD